MLVAVLTHWRNSAFFIRLHAPFEMAAKCGKRREGKCDQPPRLQLFLLSKKLRAGRAARVTIGAAGGIHLPLHSRKTGVVQFEAKKKRMEIKKDRVSGPTMIPVDLPGSLFVAWLYRRSPMAPGAFFFWAGFCRRKTVPGGREGCGRCGRPVPAPGTSQQGGFGREGRPGGPCGQGEARLAVHKSTGERFFDSKCKKSVDTSLIHDIK